MDMPTPCEQAYIREHQWSLLLPDYFPPSLNRSNKSHWSRRGKLKAKALEMLTVYSLSTGGHPTFVGPVEIDIYRLWGNRQRAWDTDNLWGSVKPLIDAMRPKKKNNKGHEGGLGIIEGDEPELLTLNVEQMKGTSKEADALVMSLGFTSGINIDHWEPKNESTLIIINGDKRDGT